MRPRIGISSCLLGEAVRYDGGHRHAAALAAALAQDFELVSLCPEREAGLGVPRPPVRLVQWDDAIHARGVSDPHLDVTDVLRACAEAKRETIAGLAGFVFKARSPSCGVDSTPLVDARGRPLAPTSGLFVQWVRTHFPALPLAEDEALADATARADFMARVWAYYRGE